MELPSAIEHWKHSVANSGKISIAFGIIIFAFNLIIYFLGFFSSDFQKSELIPHPDLTAIVLVAITALVVIIVGRRVMKGPDRNIKKHLIILLVTSVLWFAIVFITGGKVGALMVVWTAILLRELYKTYKILRNPEVVNSLPTIHYTLNKMHWLGFAVVAIFAVFASAYLDPAVNTLAKKIDATKSNLTNSDSWVEVITVDETLSVLMPSEPEEIYDTFKFGQTNRTATNETYKVIMGTVTYTVVQNSYPSHFTDQQKALQAAAGATVSTIEGKFVKQTLGEYQGYPMLDVVISSSVLDMKTRFIIRENNLYQLVVSDYVNEVNEEDYNRFVNSVKLR